MVVIRRNSQGHLFYEGADVFDVFLFRGQVSNNAIFLLGANVSGEERRGTCRDTCFINL